MSTIERSTLTDPYLAAVATALAGVPEAERQELLDDLAEHLAELVADEEAGDLAERLGAPDAYAAEFVASAGIEVPPPTPVDPPSLSGRAAAAAERVRTSPATDAVVAFLPELRPGWWVLRAWASLALLAELAGDGSVFPLPDPVGNDLVALVLLVGAVVGSVRLGRAGGQASRVLTAVGAVGLAVAALQGGPDVEYIDSSGYGGPVYGSLIGPDGQYIANIWPYDAEGNPLEGVFLFDQGGLPIDVGEQSTSGVVVPGLFPQPQVTYEYDPQTGEERQVPATAPVVGVPNLGTTSTTAETTSTTTGEPTATTTTTTPLDATTAPPG